MNKALVSAVINKYMAGNFDGNGYQIPAGETELCQLAFKYRTDKCEKIKHPFTPFYFDLLDSQHKSIRRVLEIGVGMKRKGSHSDNKTGASLYMWRDFLPSAQIYGADRDPQVMFRDRRIQTVMCDQSKPEELVNLVKTTGRNIDFLIDDASHLPQDQISTCLTLMPLLQKDVLYVIEDVANIGIQKFLGDYQTDLICLRGSNGKRYPDDNLILVRNRGVWS